MWGEGVGIGQVNFEWPKIEQLDQLPSDVTLRSIEFKSYSDSDHCINSVQCTLTDGTISPLI